MFGSSTHTKIPHTLRFTILLLRLAIGLTFFYLGFTQLFNPELGTSLSSRSVPGLYTWISQYSSPMWVQQFVPWAFLIIGSLLIIGLITRLAAVVGFIIVLIGYLPFVNYSSLNISQFVNDELVILVCLLILIAGHAGNYLGLDAVFHFGFRKKKEG